MAGFQSIVVTQKGQALLAKAQDGAPIVMTRWQIGTGALPVGTDLTAREALVSQMMDLPISNVEISGRQATVKGQFINTGLSQFRWNELGLFAKSGSSEEILYAYSNSFGDGEDIEAGEVRVREFVFGATISMGTSATIDAQIDKGLIFVTKKELEAVAARDGYISGNDTATAVMGIPCAGGPLALDNIRGNTILGGTPAYDAPVSMESVEGPLRLHMAGKNLVDMTLAADVTTAAVSCVVNAATGTLTLSGTCDRPDSAAFIFPFGSGRERGVFLPAGTYHLSGLPESYADNSVRIYVNLYNAKNQSVGSYITSDEGGISFSMEQGAWVTVNLRISDGTNVDGIVIRPQIEAGNQGTSYELPSSTTVEIPLIGKDGQELEPLRMAYGGNSSARTAYYDRIVRRNGVWCIERSVAERTLTDAVWVTSSNYAAPYFAGSGLKDGATSYLPFCTHFPPRAGAAAGQDTGVWVGNILVVGNQVLPNGAQTTAEELKSFCAAQAEAGTPVTVIYALKNPVYEELHQDVQVILNTLSVSGGTCSVWFEGDILPSGADIGLPRGDYPCSGVEGAYRWLAELSSPLPIPTRDDLYAWALEQQRGGVFATDGGVTTKNVPESGALTGILSVTEQGTDVSMIAFGPTGKIHTATRIAGVWRGWTTLYSPLSKPTPADLGAAAASHNHSADQITSGVLPLERGGLGASTWPEALKNLNAMACLATYYGTSTEPDINTILDPLFIVPIAYAKNCPLKGSLAFIMQVFYQIGGARLQIAFPFVTQSESDVFGGGMAVRIFNKASGNWSDWDAVYTAKSPPPVMTGATSSKAGTAGLAPAPAAGAQGKFLRGDGTWQTPYTHPSYAAKVSGLYKITVDKTGHVSGAETIHTGRAARFVIGTSTAGWTEADCDYLCDGTADEVEIKAAISALPSEGGEILLLDGTYNISSSIAISKANVVLRGSGPSTVLKRMFNSTSANGVIGCSAAHCRICSMDVDGNKTAYASDDNRAIYASQSASYIEIDHVTAKNSYNGISLSGMTGASILNCIVQTTSARGVYISGASGILLDGNLISGNGGTGINVQRTEDIRILNSTIDNTVDYGISIDAESKRGMISGNTCDQPQDNQSVMIHGSAFVVTGNVVGSISLGSGSKSNIVAHNILTSEDVSDAGTDNTVEGNKVVKEEATA